MINKIISSNSINAIKSSGRISYSKYLLSHKNNQVIKSLDTISNNIDTITTALEKTAIRDGRYNFYSNDFDILYPITSIDQIISDKILYGSYRDYFVFFDRSPKRTFIFKNYNTLLSNIYYFKASNNTDWNNLNNWYKDPTYMISATSLPDSNAHVVIKNTTITNSTNNIVDIRSLESNNATIVLNLNISYIALLDSTVLSNSNITGSVVLNGSSLVESDSYIEGSVIFNDSSENYGTIEHSSNIFFNDNSINNGPINSSIILNNNASNFNNNISGKINCFTIGTCVPKGISETVIVDDNLVINVPADTTTTIGSIIDNSGIYTITKDGDGILIIDGPSKIINNVIINDGTVKLEDPNALGDAVVEIKANGTLDANNLPITNTIINNGNLINTTNNKDNSNIFFNINGSTQKYIAPIACGSANYCGAVFEDMWVGCATWATNSVHAVTSVGTNGDSSFYGTYDQVGNVSNITDTIIDNIFRVTKGYDLLSSQETIEGRSMDWEAIGDGDPTYIRGFRVVSLNDIIDDDPLLTYSELMENYNDFVDVGHPNNYPDQSITIGWGGSGGSVGYSYKILKYSVTNYEYVKFLNSVDPDGINTDNIYYQFMNPEIDIVHGAIYFDENAPKGEKYIVRESWDNKPVGYVTWWSCARYCNWLNNGAKLYENSENNDINAPHNYGAYDMFASTIKERSKPSLAANYRLPTADELHKSAYYEESETFIGYHKYPTRSEKIVCVTADINGNGILPEGEECEPPEPPIYKTCTHISAFNQE